MAENMMIDQFSPKSSPRGSKSPAVPRQDSTGTLKATICLGKTPTILHTGPFYLMKDLPSPSELTGATNLMAWYGLEHSYNKFSGKKMKDSLSAFLPNLPGMLDVAGHHDNSSLRSVIDKPPIGGKGILPLTAIQLAGFRLHPGSLSIKKRHNKHKKHKNKEASLSDSADPCALDVPEKKHKKQKKHDDDRKKKKKEKKRKKRHNSDNSVTNLGQTHLDIVYRYSSKVHHVQSSVKITCKIKSLIYNFSNYTQAVKNVKKYDNENFNLYKKILKSVKGELLFGKHPINLALKENKRQFYKLYIHKQYMKLENSQTKSCILKCQEAGIPVEEINVRIIDRLCNYNVHQGMCLDASTLSYIQLKQNEVAEVQKPCLWILLDHIHDPMNFGSILRSSYFLGVEKVLVTQNGTCRLSRIVSKSSSGVMEIWPVYSINTKLFLQEVDTAGWSILGTHIFSDNKSIIKKPHVLNKPTLLILGNEKQGISEECKNYVHSMLCICPGRLLNSMVDSLNVGAAAATLIFHLLSTQIIRDKHIIKPGILSYSHE